MHALRRSLLASLFVAQAMWADPVVTEIQLVGQQRVDRFIVEVEYRVTVKSLDGPYDHISAVVSSEHTATTIVDGELTFADLIAGGTSVSDDNLIFRHDRRTPFRNEFLTIDITANSPPVAEAGLPQAVDAGEEVTLDGSGSTDADGGALRFAWALLEVPAGSSAALSDPMSVGPTFTADIQGSYTARLIVNDGMSDSAPDTVMIQAGPGNLPPNALICAPSPARVDQLLRLDGSCSTDADGDTLTYRWMITDRPDDSVATLSTHTAVNPSFTPDTFGSYEIQLQVTDEDLASSTATLQIHTLNTPPVARAGDDQTAQVGDLVSLDGSESFDADGQVLTFRWSITAQPPTSSATLSQPTDVMPTLPIDGGGKYVVQLIVNDGVMDSQPDTIVIDSQAPPVARICPTPLARVGVRVALDGSCSSDIDGDPLTFSWSLISQPEGSAASLSDKASGMPILTPTVAGVHVVQLIVNDGARDSVPATVEIDAEGNPPPVADAGPDQMAPLGPVKLDGSGSTDVDGDPLTYRWSVLSRPADSATELDDKTAVMPTLGKDAPGPFVLQLIVNDGFSDSEPDTVVIADDEAQLPLAVAGLDQFVQQNELVCLDGAESSDPQGDLLTFRWTLMLRPEDSEAQLDDPTTLQPCFTVDVQGMYVAQLIVNDGVFDSSPDTTKVTVGGNPPPVADAGSDRTGVPVGSSVTLDGGESSDLNDDPLTYSWTLLTTPEGSEAELDDRTSVMPTFVADQDGVYVAQLIVNDGSSDSRPDTVAVATAIDANGDCTPLVNGGSFQGSISAAGDTDECVFSAAVGDRFEVRIGEIADSNGEFGPWVRIFAPDDSSVGSSYGSEAAYVTGVASQAGLYRVVIASGDSGADGLGDYRLSFAITSGPATASGDGGPVASGAQVAGSIPAGDLDVWTIQAAAGDRIFAHVGEATDGNEQFTPWVRLWGPNGQNLGSSYSSAAAEVDNTAPSAGTYYILVSSGDSGVNGIGDYRLTVAKTAGAITVAAGDEGGAVTSGGLVTGSIPTGDLDVWTIDAEAGDRIFAHVGESSDTNGSFTPWVRLWGPNGQNLGSSYSAAASEVDNTAPITGRYYVLVSSGDSGVDGTGAYRLTVARTAGLADVAPGDEGGSVASGDLTVGSIPTGDLDVFTIDAAAGDRIFVHVGEITDANSEFVPWVRLWGPNGQNLGSSYSAAAAEVDSTAPVSGTYYVLISSGDSGVNGTGQYRLTVARTGESVTVAPGDHGGPLANGALVTGSIATGDLDVWTFQASAGDRIFAHLGETVDSNNEFTPWVRLWGPNGQNLGSSYSASAAEIDNVAPTTGVYYVLVSSGDSGVNGTGDYQLTVAKTAGLVTVSAGDEGGPASNGILHAGAITVGDLDIWTIQAAAGDRIFAHVGEVVDVNGELTPWVRLWGPGGINLGSSYSAAAAEVDGTAPVDGVYYVLVSSGDSGVDGAGTYQLTVATTSGSVAVSTGDEGGLLSSASRVAGVISVGDLDVWTIQATAGDHIVATLTETADANGEFAPWVRVFASNGANLGSSYSAESAEVDGAATVSGRYYILVSSGDSGVNGSGAYQLVVTLNP